jgi:peptidoglycan-N-acetylglucosamine deacetylase
MRHFISVCLIAGYATGVLAADQPPLRRDVQAACFSPAALASSEGERLPRRIVGRAVPPPSLTVEDRGGTSKQAQPPLGAIRRVVLPAGAPKLIALTLDFCEQSHEISGYDGAIIDLLRRERVPATLFMGGKWMLSHEPRMQQLMTDPLFEVGTHGWVHRNVRGLSGASLQSEMMAPTAAYRMVRANLTKAQCAVPQAAGLRDVPERPALTRFPFGACHADSLAVAQQAGMAVIQWDVSTGDPSPETSARAIAATMLRQTKPGSIILAHANGRGVHTAEALPAAIKGLRERGFVFTTVSALLAAGPPEIVSSCYDRVPGDTDKYDRLFVR